MLDSLLSTAIYLTVTRNWGEEIRLAYKNLEDDPYSGCGKVPARF